MDMKLAFKKTLAFTMACINIIGIYGCGSISEDKVEFRQSKILNQDTIANDQRRIILKAFIPIMYIKTMWL